MLFLCTSILLLAVPSSGQEAVLKVESLSLGQNITLGRPVEESHEPASFVLQYTFQEKCYECGFRTLMVCGPDPDCNTPDKTSNGFKGFESTEKAMAWANEQKLRGFAVVALFKTFSIPVTPREVSTTIPARTEKHTEYSTAKAGGTVK